MSQTQVTAFFEPVTSTFSYVAADPASGRCAIVDPVLDYDPRAARLAMRAAETIADHIRQHGLQVDWVLDTHVHADHFTAATALRERLGGQTGIGENLPVIQRLFREIYNLGPDFAVDGSQYDHLFSDGEAFQVGGLRAWAIHTPGHTPACVCYLIGDALFVGDVLLMPDYGTARCDFPGGDAATLYRSIGRLLSLPPETRMFVAHDYAPDGRPFACETTVAAQRGNVHLRDDIDEDAFVRMRQARDADLELPAQMLAAIQANVRAGVLPAPEENGVAYLKIPVNRF